MRNEAIPLRFSHNHSNDFVQTRMSRLKGVSYTTKGIEYVYSRRVGLGYP